jgi:hypothetical protein
MELIEVCGLTIGECYMYYYCYAQRGEEDGCAVLLFLISFLSDSNLGFDLLARLSRRLWFMDFTRAEMSYR